MIDEEADAAEIFKDRSEELERPEDAQWPSWSGSLRVAWQALKNDRFYGAMGGMGTIYYSSISQWVRDAGMPCAEIQSFAYLLLAIDEEYVAFCAEQEKARTENPDPKT